MFGYHDSDRCKMDLWSPVDDPNGCAIENRAFSPYAKHTQEVDDVIAAIVTAAREGKTQLSFELDDDFSESDLEYIRREVQRQI